MAMFSGQSIAGLRPDRCRAASPAIDAATSDERSTHPDRCAGDRTRGSRRHGIRPF